MWSGDMVNPGSKSMSVLYRDSLSYIKWKIFVELLLN